MKPMRKKRKKKMIPRKMDADMLVFIEEDILRMKERGMFSSAENLRTAFNHFKIFVKSSFFPLGKLNTVVVKDFERYLKAERLMASTISLYMRVLHASYNRAVEAQLVTNSEPFAEVRRGNVCYSQYALTQAEMNRLLEAEVSQGGWEELARDVMELSYEFCGMPPVDIIFLKWSQIDFDAGMLCYSRHKTRTKGTVAISKKAKNILLKYRKKDHEKEDLGYVFSFIKSADGEEAYAQYKSALRQINRNLNQLGKRFGLRYHLSTYVIRRTWATVARNVYGAQPHIISLALCHTSDRTTSIYISRIDDGKLFDLQKKMWKEPKKTPPIKNRGTAEGCVVVKDCYLL